MPNLPSLKVHRRSLDRRAADILREEILSGRFPPGFRLVVTAREGRVAPAAEADLALHRTIVALANHRRLSQQYDILEQQVRRYMVSSNVLMHDTGEIGDQHRPLVEAILDGRPDEAEAL